MHPAGGQFGQPSPYGAPPPSFPQDPALWGVPPGAADPGAPPQGIPAEGGTEDDHDKTGERGDRPAPSPYGDYDPRGAAPPAPGQNPGAPPAGYPPYGGGGGYPGGGPGQGTMEYEQGYGGRGLGFDPRYQRRFAQTPVVLEEQIVQGIVELQKDGAAFLRFIRNNMLAGPDDVFVAHQLVRRYDLRDGSMVEGPIEPPRRRGQRPGLRDVIKVDGMAPDEAAKLPRFSELTVIDPDFHYELGDAGDLSLRVLDLLCPVGRGQRGLIVAPPRTGKTVFLHKVAQAMERLYPDVHLMVLLVDERPEEGTMWKRLVKGDVFLSTLDEGTKHHVALSEAVFRRALRLVECKKDVMLLLDSITRMSRAYNAETGNSGRILTGGIDSRTMEKPKRMFGAARNTEGGGALTVLGTTLVDTGSKMDQVIFEEFKGTGNMELVLSRQLADRRIFPAFDIGLSGTRKEEKLLSPAKLRRIVTLRRVLQKMKPIEAMEQLLIKLERTPNNDEFLKQFELSGADM
jgi:transcription termination factor Rho